MKDINKHNSANHTVTITVNNNPVDIEGPRTTGLAIKEAAIKAGLTVETDFLLTQVAPGDKNIRIGDDDPVTVTPQSEFTMISDDHDS